MIKKAYPALTLIAVTLALPVAVQADVTVYGKIHMSADVVGSGVFGYGVSSNTSRIGFKGKEDLSYGLKALFKIESEVDISSESNQFKSRNRYLGLNLGKSTLIGGYHDTPFKTLGAKVDVLINTIADRRGILGRNYLGGEAVGNVSGGSEFDVRAANSVMYINRMINGLDFRFMRTAGSVNGKAGDTTPITSTSVLYKAPHFILGGAYEAKEADRTSGVRALAGVAFGATRITGIYEKLSFDPAGGSDWNVGWNRSTMGFSATHKMGATSLKAQAFIANDLDAIRDSRGRMYAAGLYHQLAKTFTVYGVLARMENAANATYTLSSSGHGDKYYPLNKGATLNAVSVGGIYGF